MKSRLIKIMVLMISTVILFEASIYGNDEDNEIIEMKNVWEEIAQTGVDAEDKLITNSKAFIVWDRVSKTTILEKNSKEKRAMASTTKIMTAILVLENGNLNEIIEVSR